MADEEAEELASLREEFQWVLKYEVHSVLKHLREVLQKFISIFRKISHVKAEKFMLSSANGSDNIKGVITVFGDNICHADITIRLHRHANQSYRTFIKEDIPWKLQQVQDAGNHLQCAVDFIALKGEHTDFQTAQEVITLMSELMVCLQRARNSLLSPKKYSLEELYRNKSMRAFNPPLPVDSIINFYVHHNKLVMSTYYLTPAQGPRPQKPSVTSIESKLGSTFEVGQYRYEVAAQYQVECAVPWLNDVITLFTVALQTCQQLKDKKCFDFVTQVFVQKKKLEKNSLFDEVQSKLKVMSSSKLSLLLIAVFDVYGANAV
uniref:Protein rogdi homolog n=1 Tax=Saccoglossus kowalevskii TaxID=10224 RepID=A0ABM0MW07_SACKO|nr:PREDICTED: protein rogdi homolog [Saccoglossus kowalevskii]